MVGGKSGTKQGSSKEFLRASERGCSCCRWCSVDPVDYASPGRAALRFLLYRARGSFVRREARGYIHEFPLPCAQPAARLRPLPAGGGTGRLGERKEKTTTNKTLFFQHQP